MENTNNKPAEVGNLFKRIKIRFIILIKALTTRNIILICVNEFKENGENGRNVSLTTRTDYTNESDFLTITAALQIKEKHLRKENGF